MDAHGLAVPDPDGLGHPGSSGVGPQLRNVDGGLEGGVSGTERGVYAPRLGVALGRDLAREAVARSTSDARPARAPVDRDGGSCRRDALRSEALEEIGHIGLLAQGRERIVAAAPR